jgi:hypothetical protein
MDELSQRVDRFLLAAYPWPRSHPSTAIDSDRRNAA